MLKFDITALKTGVHQETLRPKPEALDLDPAEFADIEVGLTLDYDEDRVLAMIEVRATATLECDRTLVFFDQSVSGTYTVLYAPPAMLENAEGEYEDLRPLLPTDTQIDLTEPVRDTLLLALPVRRIAPGAEDIELPRHFGKNEDDPIDPRWEALRALRSEDSET